nr:hypothetical protein GCM10020092_015790 [Actinoplanes digitatis]
MLGHVAARPVPGPDALLPLAGALLGGALLLVALDAQANRRWSAWSDDAAYLLAAAGLAGLVVDSAVSAPRASAGWPARRRRARRDRGPRGGRDRLLPARGTPPRAYPPNERILEASKTAGTLLDSAFGVEPSFVTEMIERRYWARRRLRSRRLSTRVPVLVAQDLILLRRQPRRLLWLA